MVPRRQRVITRTSGFSSGSAAPLAIVADVVLIGQSIPLGSYLKRQKGETTWTSRLREHHLHFIGIDLALCLAVIDCR